ncbi:MAG: site-specific DNA-methyltransferase [Shewanella sp.]|uniref:site-specific DNA-methyltransferase n=1 Tax=Shewanella sp. TaxID=50422 RepID=UPI003F34CF7C
MQKINKSSPEVHSADLIANNIEQLKALFPNLITESAKGAAINVDVLKALVGDQTVTDAEEKYGLNWHGKRQARQLALTPSTGTLRPCQEESVDWDSTENLMIEGDNLEVLKLLQKSYAGKVKMIYIDPPYNTGKDFVYPDNFHDNIKNYLELTGQSEDGVKLSTNSETSGRYHTDWLNMMLPRLTLARNLLRDDGVIFISIDDNEQANLKALCDDVFGGENFVANLIWERAYSPVNLKKHFSENHDHIICYAKKSVLAINIGLKRGDEANGRYANPDNDHRGPWKSSDLSVGPTIQDKIYEIITPSGRIVSPSNGRCWVLNKIRFDEFKSENRIWFGTKGDSVPSIKRFLSEVKNTVTPMTIWKYQDVGHRCFSR